MQMLVPAEERRHEHAAGGEYEKGKEQWVGKTSPYSRNTSYHQPKLILQFDPTRHYFWYHFQLL